MVHILFSSNAPRWAEYRQSLIEALAAYELDFTVHLEIDPAQVDYIIYDPAGGIIDFSPYVKCQAVLCLWAGVDSIVGNSTLHAPLTRMVDAGLTQGMVEWVVGHSLRHQLRMDCDILRQDGAWVHRVTPLAAERPVTILGMGTSGYACATALSGLGFAVTGWSRTLKRDRSMRLLHGEDGLNTALRQAQIVILLLSATPFTRRLINASRLAYLPQGAVLLSAGRGELIDDIALIASLNSGHLCHATLDVFASEPLPSTHPFWAHPRVTVTPHIASTTRPSTAARVLAENIWRHTIRQPLLHLVDRNNGY